MPGYGAGPSFLETEFVGQADTGCWQRALKAAPYDVWQESSLLFNSDCPSPLAKPRRGTNAINSRDVILKGLCWRPQCHSLYSLTSVKERSGFRRQTSIKVLLLVMETHLIKSSADWGSRVSEATPQVPPATAPTELKLSAPRGRSDLIYSLTDGEVGTKTSRVPSEAIPS